MKIIRATWLIIIVSFQIIVVSCKHPLPANIARTSVSFDSLHLKTYADTIICDMVVKNPDKDDAWIAKCLGHLQRKALIDSIFDDLYNGKLLAYDYATNKALSVEDVKKAEQLKGYSRNIIGKFQFREAWFYDKQKHIFIKKVYSIIFGYEAYDDKGFVKGYRPLFKVEF